jgi:hypothetical protein
MKHISTVILNLLICGLAFTPASAGTQSAALAQLQMTVAPNIAVSSTTSTLNFGSIQTGGFYFPLAWNVQANVEQVYLMLEASNLYKGDDASLTDTTKIIGLDSGRPADVVPANGNAVMQGSTAHRNVLAWTGGPGAGIPGNPATFPTVKSEVWAFESSQLSDFSQIVNTNIYYKGPILQQAQGVYSGRVRFTAFITPPAP